MPLDPQELSQAVVAALGYGTAIAPLYDRARLVSELGAQRAAAVEPALTALLRELTALPIDWSQHSLESAGAWAQAEMQRRHPALSELALRALAWKFTYDAR